MKKLYSYLAVGFAFFAAGLITMYKLMGDQISITIKKVKQKRTSGTNSITVPIDVSSKEKRVKLTKEERKAKRKLKRANK